MTNPLLEPWTAPFELPPFDRIEDAHFEEALAAGFAQARANIKTIAESPERPTFQNTIVAMELSEILLDRVVSVFFAMAGADSTPAREELQRKLAPELSAYSSEVMLNPSLFLRIEELWGRRDQLGLDDEEMRVLMLKRRNFIRSGARLHGPSRTRLTEVKDRLATLGTAFVQNLLADERDWAMELTDADLDGLPEFVRSAMRAAGKDRGMNGPALTLARSVIVPFLQFSPRRDLRETAYRAWAARGANGGETDNRTIAAETLALRQERAELLGYPDFAHFKLETEMARTPGAVRELLESVWKPAKAQTEADEKVLSAMAAEDGLNGPLEPWDWRYFAEKRRAAEHDLDEAELKPYFQLDRMIEAAFDCATRLFGLTFKQLDVPLYHADFRAWEVLQGDRHMAVFIGDYYARSSKRSGAWCSGLRQQRNLMGEERPVTINVCNFAKPEEGQPCLLSFDDARTLFHEFGHALHHILSDIRFPSISGTSVARDFVELPSQLFEHWLEVPEVLQKFATHAETGEAIPADLLDRLIKARNFDMGFATVEYVESAMVDLAFHSGPAPADPMARQAEVLAEMDAPRAIPMRHATPHFAHVFAGDGYSSGYYSYMCSEVMDADAFRAFEEADDPFDPETAQRLRTHILGTGGSAEPDTLYTAFRGRMPGVDALLEGRGLKAAV